jgi:sugar phosphate isomerase/epimerase
LIAPGLCSITFRTRSANEVLDIAARSGVEGIEWGADAHVAPGDLATAERIAARSRDVGIEVASYGSYLGFTPPDGDDGAKTAAVLDSAEALGAPMVRIWTELGVSPDAAPDDRRRVTHRTAGFVDAVAARGLVAALEFHPFTLTETAASANRLLDDLARSNLRTHWQPDPALAAADAVDELAAVTGRLAHLHVFSWGPDGIADRRPLADGAAVWAPALALAERDGAPLAGRRYALCEYVRGDEPDQLVADVHTLRRWLGSLGPPGSLGPLG